jgi:hypothetical protein
LFEPFAGEKGEIAGAVAANMFIRIIVATAVTLSVVGASDAWALCRRVTLTYGVGVPVFKHYRHDGGQVVDVVSNDDLVRYYRSVGSKAKVRKLQLDKVRQVGWVSRDVLSKWKVPCTLYRPTREQQATYLFDLFQRFLDGFKPFTP